ncbi:PH domain-containing protein [Halosimplex pelagicum]|uniref:PH domain-containing protein n=1 Tax=Halosimplex pelagicum TaxID=869886 RepID=A0A7D5SVB9_9EURY|nr:PH domain-containing protein [Halosimplex pelagicum]
MKPASEGRAAEDGSNTTESPKSFQGKLALFIISGLAKFWHAIILGFQWLLPRATGTTDPQSGLSGRFYPNSMIRQDEEVIYAGNPSRWLSPGPYVFSGILLLLSFVITVAVPLGYGEPLLDAVTPNVLDLSVPSTWWYAPVLFTAIAILLLVYVVLIRASTWHLVTDKRLIHRENVLAPNRTRLDLVDINSIDCRQPLPERWYNVGYIDIYTASTGGKELVFEGVKNGPTVANEIDQVRYEYQQRIRGGYPEGEEGEDGDRQAHPRDQERGGHPRQGHQDHGSQQSNGARSPRSREQQQQPERPGSGRSAGDRPQGERRDDSQSGGGGTGDPFAESTGDPFAQEGDSIEEQRPDHSLQDDLDDPFRGED